MPTQAQLETLAKFFIGCTSRRLGIGVGAMRRRGFRFELISRAPGGVSLRGGVAPVNSTGIHEGAIRRGRPMTLRLPAEA